MVAFRAMRDRHLKLGLLALAATLAVLALRRGGETGIVTAKPAEPEAAGARASTPSASAESAPRPRVPALGALPRMAWRRQTLVRAAWGSAPGELGHIRGGEGSPEGPMSFAVGDDGRVIVLDQVNARVQIFDDGSPTIVPLPRDTFDDLAPAGDGLVVLDRLGAGTLLSLGLDGGVRDEVPLRGQGVDDPGDVTALRTEPDGTWVEVGHRDLVHLLDPDGRAAAARTFLTGRPHADGSGRLLQAARVGPSAAEVRLGDGGPLARVDFELPLWHITALESTVDGRVFLGAELVLEAPTPPYDLLDHREEVVVLAGDGAELGRVPLRANEVPEQVMQRLRVAPDGSLYHLGFDDDGATVWRYVP